MTPEQVPVAHFSHHLEAKLDLGFDRAWTRELYAERGRPSIGPFVFFKPQLIMFFAGIRSGRQLIAMASLNLAHRWDLGYAPWMRRCPTTLASRAFGSGSVLAPSNLGPTY